MNQSWLEEKVFEQVVSSNILEKYRQTDSSLDKLLLEISKAPNIWKVHPNIFVSVPASHPAHKVEEIFRRRLKTIPPEIIYDDKREATRHLINFCISNPNVDLCSVTFNCPDQHYGVFCGRNQEEIVTICVLTGGHIPSQAFKR